MSFVVSTDIQFSLHSPKRSSSSDNIGLKVGLAVGLGVPAVILLLAIIVGLVMLVFFQSNFHIIFLRKRRV